jgi:hypothetical protein
MKFKYLLRGLGIGIVITACIMGAYTRSAVANARVAVMKEYGFGEEATLVWEDLTQSTETETDTETAIESETETEETIPIIVRDEPSETETETVEESETESETESVTEIQSTTEEEAEGVIDGKVESSSSEAASEAVSEAVSKSASELPEYIEITVAGGDDSGKVSRKLYNAGIIDSASEYDAFLMQHGYDKKITVGVKTIYITDTWQDIAEKLTSK